MPETSLKCFGVGDGMPSADRYHSSYLYTVGGFSLLIDCGEPVSRSFKASGLDYDTIDCLLPGVNFAFPRDQELIRI